MNVQEKPLTVEEFLALPDDGNDYELLEGAIIPMMRPKPLHSVTAYFIADALGTHVYPNQLGLVAHELGFKLPYDAGSLVFPDVAYVSKNSLPNPDLTEYLPVAPDLVVEIVSPNDVAEKLMDKIGAYFKAGTQIVWVVYPDEQLVQVYRGSIVNVTGVGIDSALDGGDVLPGFNLPLKAIFRTIGSQS
ncbi:MAG: Uma2 family endonuclease [Aggregatilineales bacterium]